MHVTIFLTMFETCMNVLFVVEAKNSIFLIIKWLYIVNLPNYDYRT